LTLRAHLAASHREHAAPYFSVGAKDGRRGSGIVAARIALLPVRRYTPMSIPASTSSAALAVDPDTVVQDTIRWLERAVIGLNLCPFAKGVHSKGQIHYVVSQATDGRELIQELERELEALAEISPEKRDTTLLMAPACFEEFLDFNDFLEVVDGLIDALDLGGILQVASFHPRFQFEGTEVDDVTNCTNRRQRRRPWISPNCGRGNRSSCSRNCTFSRAKGA